MNQTMTKMFLAAAVALAGYVPDRPITRTCHKAPQAVDCDKVKETCTRKTGCKCKRECDEHGRRLPAAGGRAECPSYCCEDKCKCHEVGCP